MFLHSLSKYISGAAFAMLALTVAAQAQTIDFEDATPQDSFFVAQGYKGFQWTGGQGTSSWVLATPSDGLDIFSAHSGTNYIWSNGGTSLTMSGAQFDFTDMWAMSGEGAGSVTAHGFLNNNEIYNQTFAIGTTYSDIAVNFNGIDQITFDTTPFNLVVDDITVNGSQSVPEGGTTLGMLGLALGALCWMRRKIASA